MAAHRYWRINVTVGNAGAPYVGCAELGLRTNVGGLSVTSGGTASASENYPGLPPANAFDLSDATDWVSNGSALPQWLKYDFGSGNDKDIVEVEVVARAPTTQTVNSFDVQYSDNNSSWTTLYSVAAAAAWGTSEHRVYTYASGYPATSKVWWRVNCTANDGHAFVWAVSSLQMRTTVSGADQCSGGVAGASTYFDYTFLPTKAFDSDATTSWASSVPTGWVSYQFASAKQIVEVSITARTAAPSQAPKDFTVQYWDGAAWQTQWTVTGSSAWSAGETRVFADPSPPAPTAARGNVCVIT
jgi:F5/8 type C domain/NedA-like, galactose-binding domain